MFLKIFAIAFLSLTSIQLWSSTLPIIDSFAGSVEITRAESGSNQAAFLRALLQPSDVVTTGSNGFVRILWPDSSTSWTRGNSVFSGNWSEGTQPPLLHVTQQRGSTFWMIKNSTVATNQFKVYTPVATVTTKGASFFTDILSGKATLIKVVNGTVAVKSSTALPMFLTTPFKCLFADRGTSFKPTTISPQDIDSLALWVPRTCLINTIQEPSAMLLENNVNNAKNTKKIYTQCILQPLFSTAKTKLADSIAVQLIEVLQEQLQKKCTTLNFTKTETLTKEKTDVPSYVLGGTITTAQITSKAEISPTAVTYREFSEANLTFILKLSDNGNSPTITYDTVCLIKESDRMN